MDQENYNDIDMEIEMDSNDIDVSAEMPNEIVVNNYNSLKNKPSINSVELVGNKTLEDLGITEYVEGEIANFDFIKIVPQLPEKGLINRTYFVPKTDPESNDLYEEYMWINNKWEMMGTKQIQVDLTAYVKNTDYAKPDKGGTIKTGNGVSLKNGVIQTDSIDYNAYKDSSNEYFIGKGTLEKVIEGKELINKEYSDNIVEEQRLENERLRNDIKSIALPGEASGENIHIEDSSDARCEIEIDGNQKQDVRIGKNKLLNDTASMTINGVTFTKNDDGSVIANGTATDGINYYLSEISTTIEAGIYKLSDGVNDESSTTYFTYVDCKNEDGSAYDAGNLSTAGESSKAYSEPKLIRGRITVRKGITLSNVLFKPQLELVKSVNDVATDYEQYGASPSIDYPSPVKSVGDNVNYFDINSVTNSLIILESGNLYPNDSWRTTDFIEVKANIYTLSWESITDYFQCNIAFYDKDKKYLSYIQYTNRTFSNTFDVKNNAKYMRISYNVKGGETSYAREKIKLEIGNKRTEYSSYNCGSAKVKFQDRNIMPISQLGTNWEYTDKGIKNTTISGGKNLTNFKLKAGQTIKIGFKLFSKPSQDSTFTWYINGAQAIILSFGKIEGFELNKIYQRTYTATEDCKIKSTLWGNSNKDIFEFQMWAEYDNLTEYQKYDEQSYLVDVQQEMLDGDTFVRQDGKWYEKHNWITLLNENIINNIDGIKNESKKTITTSISLTETPAKKSAISNILTYANNWNDTEHMIFSASLNTIYCLYNKDRFSELNYETIKKEIGEFGGIIKYKSNKSTYLECTETQSKVLDEIYNKAHTYKNITNISAESLEVNPIVSLKYLKDTEKYIEDKITTALTEINALNQVRTQMLDAEVEI